MVLVPAGVEAFKAFRGETNACCCGEVEVSAVEKIEEGVLEDFRPNLEIFEVCAATLCYMISISSHTRTSVLHHTARPPITVQTL